MFGRYLRAVDSFFSSLFGPTPTEPEPEPPEKPPNLLTGNGATRTIEVELHQSERLTGKNGRYPEEVVAIALADAFDAAGVSYAIGRMSEPVHFTSAEQGSSETLAEFRSKYGQDGRDVDARLCLLDTPGSGVAELAGVYGVMGVNNIDERFDPSRAEVPLSPRERNVRGAIHEVGHSLGGRHLTPILADAPEMAYSEAMKKQIRHYIETGNADPTN